MLGNIFYVLVGNWWYLWLALMRFIVILLSFTLRGGDLGQFSEQSFKQDFFTSVFSDHHINSSFSDGTPFALLSFCARGTMHFQCTFVWEQLTGPFLNPLVDSTYLCQFLGQPSFPFLCLRRNTWLRGLLWRNCENASTWDGKGWEKCNNFVGEEDIKNCIMYMSEEKNRSS